MLTIGHIYEAELVGEDRSRSALGVTVQTKDGLFPGIVPFYEIPGKEEDFVTYKKGSKLRVMLISTDRNIYKFSVKAVETHLANHKSEYTGIPDQDGSLPLKGYYLCPDRMRQMLKWIAEVQLDYMDADSRPLEMPKDLVLTFVSNKLKGETGAERVDSRGLGSIIRGMAALKYEWLVLCQDADNNITGFRLTDFGMSEATASAKVVLPPLKVAEPVALKGLPDAPVDHYAGLGEFQKKCLKHAEEAGLKPDVAAALALLMAELNNLKDTEGLDFKGQVELIREQSKVVQRILLVASTACILTPIFDSMHVIAEDVRKADTVLDQLDRVHNRLIANVKEAEEAKNNLEHMFERIRDSVLSAREEVLNVSEEATDDSASEM